MLDYIYDMEAEQYSFIRVPKILLQHEIYQRITPEAKLLYSLLLIKIGIELINKIDLNLTGIKLTDYI